MKVFLSYSFRKEDEALAAQLKEALGNFGFEIVTGKHLGGQNLEAEINRRIDGVDGLVTLFSRRAKGERNEATLDWVKAELAYARNHGKLAIVMIEKSVPLGGPEASNEYVSFTRSQFCAALMQLLQKVVVWRDRVGRRIRVHLMPVELAEKFKYDDGSVQCWLRYIRNGSYGEWSRVEQVVFEDRGAVAYIAVPEAGRFQLKVVEPSRGTNRVWISPAVPSDYVPVTLET